LYLIYTASKMAGGSAGSGAGAVGDQ